MPTGFYGMMRHGDANETLQMVQRLNPFAMPYRVHAVGADDQTLLIVCAGPLEKLDSMYADTPDMTAVISGSIYNRGALYNELSCARLTADAALVCMAWRRWGAETPQHINGDWMFAVYLKEVKELYLIRSWGFSSSYYRMEGTSFAFSTNLRALTELEGKRAGVDIKALMLVLCTAGLPEPDESPYREIVQLPPASVLHLSCGQFHIKEYWRPSWEKRQTMVSEEDALEQFAALYAGAVKARLEPDGSIGATLSAGLDSGSVCALAARALSQTEQKLYAWTAVPKYPAEAYATSYLLSDESEMASNVSKSYPNIIHRLIDCAQTNPIRSVWRQEVLTGRPQWTCANYYWMEDVLAEAAANGCAAVLLGQFGNGTVSWSPQHIKLFPKSLFFPGVPWKRYIKYPGYKFRQNIAGTKKELSHQMKKPEDKYPSVNPALLHTENFKQIQRSEAWQPPKEKGQAALQELNMGLFDVHYQMGFMSGVEFRDPTSDVELIRFLLSLPENIYFRDGMDRRVMRLGMKGILPDENRLNRHRGRQGADILPRIRENMDYAESALAYISQSSMAGEIINLPYMESILSRLKRGETNASLMLECSKHLLPGFSCGFFTADYDLNSRFDG